MCTVSPFVLVASITKPRYEAPLDIIIQVRSWISKQQSHATRCLGRITLQCKYLSPNDGPNGMAGTCKSGRKIDTLLIWSGRGRSESGTGLALLIGTPFGSNYPDHNMLMPSFGFSLWSIHRCGKISLAHLQPQPDHLDYKLSTMTPAQPIAGFVDSWINSILWM